MAFGRLKKEAYNNFSKIEISLLTFLLSHADLDGIVEIYDKLISERLEISYEEFLKAKEEILSYHNIKHVCNADRLETGFIGGMEVFRFIWDTKRLPESKWAKIRKAIFKRDNYTCFYCGSHGKALECDHVVPISRGGSNDPENLVTACKPCNQSKRNKTLKEWIQ